MAIRVIVWNVILKEIVTEVDKSMTQELKISGMCVNAKVKFMNVIAKVVIVNVILVNVIPAIANVIFRSVMWVVLVIVSTAKITIVVHWLTAENKRTELITHHVKTETGREMREGRTDLISEETTEMMKAGHMKNKIETTTLIARVNDRK